MRVCYFGRERRFFRSGGGRKRARAERARREARRKTRDRWPNARHHSVREKHRRDRLRSRHAPAAEATSRMGDVPVLLVYANPKAKPPPRHALASALWFRTSSCRRSFPVASGRRNARVLTQARTNARDVDAACRRLERRVRRRGSRESEKDPSHRFAIFLFFFFFNSSGSDEMWRFDRSIRMKSRAATDSEPIRNRVVGSGRTLAV